MHTWLTIAWKNSKLPLLIRHGEAAAALDAQKNYAVNNCSYRSSNVI
jgi:hypothetical protein